MQLQPTHISNTNAIIKLFSGPFINIDKYRSIVSINKSPRGVPALIFLAVGGTTIGTKRGKIFCQWSRKKFTTVGVEFRGKNP